MASGERPLKGDTAMSILTSIMRDTPRPISEVKRDLPPDFGRIVRRCLAKDPEDRYQTAKDLRNDLRGLREDMNSGERVSLSSASVPSVTASSSNVSTSAASQPTRRSRMPLVAAGVLAVAIIAGIAGWQLFRGGAVEPSARPESFATIGLTRVTTTGTAGLATLSQDGRYVAHVVSD